MPRSAGADVRPMIERPIPPTARRSCRSAASSITTSTGASVRAPHVPWRDTIIYELHVKGYTQRHPRRPAGASRQIPRARAPCGARSPAAARRHVGRADALPCLGQRAVPGEARADELLGLQPARLVRARRTLCGRPTPVVEFKTMVRALHAAGLEVILDVVFNHTAEGDHRGPTLSLRGFDNPSYYRLPPHDRSLYENFSGTGNTVSFDHPAVRSLVIDCLRYWVSEMGVDGFRFDLAPVLGRGQQRLQQSCAASSPRCVPTRCSPIRSSSPSPGMSVPAATSSDIFRRAGRNGTIASATRRARSGAATGRCSGTFAERFAGSSDLFRHHGRKPTATRQLRGVT